MNKQVDAKDSNCKRNKLDKQNTVQHTASFDDKTARKKDQPIG
jgi:hypothetical protein